MSAVPKFRIDVNVHSLWMNSESQRPEVPVDKGISFPEPVYPRFPKKLSDPGPETPSGDLHFAEWNCRAGQNNVIIRTDGTVAPCFPMSCFAIRLGQYRSSEV